MNALDPSTLTKIWTILQCSSSHPFCCPSLDPLFTYTQSITSSTTFCSPYCPPSSTTFSLSLPRTISPSHLLSSLLSSLSSFPFSPPFLFLFFFFSQMSEDLVGECSVRRVFGSYLTLDWEASPFNVVSSSSSAPSLALPALPLRVACCAAAACFR